MVSRFDEDAATYNEELLYEFGEEATLHPGGAAARAVSGMASKEEVAERVENDGIIQVRTRTFKLRTADAGDPTAGATLTIEGLTYHIEGQSAPRGGLVTLNLVRHETVERSKPAYRS